MKGAILGLGNMGIGHASRVVQAGHEVACVCDQSRSALAGFVEATGLTGVGRYTDYEAMLEENNLDFLLICLPPFAQQGQFEEAARRGIPIFIEKPIALSTEAGASMVAAARQGGIVTSVGFHMRQSEPVRRLLREVREGLAGRPVLFSAQYECNALHPAWWRDRQRSGGQLFEQAIHLYDLARLLFGNPLSVSAVMANQCHGHISDYTVEDVSASTARFLHGGIGVITATNCAVPTEWNARFTAVYENITATFHSPDRATFTYTAGGEARQEEVRGEGDAYQLEIEEFLDCVQRGRRAPCDISEGLLSLRYVEAATESATLAGRSVPV